MHHRFTNNVANPASGPDCSVPATGCAGTRWACSGRWGAIADKGHVAAAAEHNSHWLPWVSEKIDGLGLEAIPSVGNFVLARFPGDRFSAAAEAYLTARGFVLREVGAYGLPDCLRLTIGTEAANRGVIEALAAFTKDFGHGR